MNKYSEYSYNELLENAISRGKEVTNISNVVPGADHVLAYIGLIADAIELGKLMSTEKRDLAAIEADYRVRMSEINKTMSLLEQTLKEDFQKEMSRQDKTFDMISTLIAAGQYEIAAIVHAQLFNKSGESRLERIFDARKSISFTGNRLLLK